MLFDRYLGKNELLWNTTLLNDDSCYKVFSRYSEIVETEIQSTSFLYSFIVTTRRMEDTRFVVFGSRHMPPLSKRNDQLKWLSLTTRRFKRLQIQGTLHVQNVRCKCYNITVEGRNGVCWYDPENFSQST